MNPTTDRLRHDISRGRSGGKVNFSDPAAAPLGTDDEAAGTPPSTESIKLAYDLEIGRPVSSNRDDVNDGAVYIYGAVILGIVIGIGGGLLLF
jgi:hypothetical protein